MEKEMIDREYAVAQVREMAFQYAELYFAFVSALRDMVGEEQALSIAQQVLFRRTAERAQGMVERAQTQGIPRIPDNIVKMTDVPYLGWDPAFGRDQCPYGAAWNRRIEEYPWFRKFACLYCSVTDTTIAEIFTGDHTHQILKSVVQGDEDCERRYDLSADVKNGYLTYGKL